ncbi:methyl-accepting chemotaxis protein [Baaleninema simplex]|uniref:methyl-accepting chemotaxis protein n=1 Tax=Baaleninema simplex TaxID=2862350 RepID=UPI000364E417|nr:methyl-accepting chemotaxis protein [Baaleninema simplex]
MQTNKTSQAHTRHFQRYLVAASALGIFLVSAIVAAVAVFPLSRQLKVEARRELKFAAQTRVFTVEELLSRLQSIAMQITSRTRARQVLEAYDRGEIDRSEFVTTSQRILTDALNQSEEVVGITRLNEEGNLAVSVGREIPRAWWVVPPATAQTSLVRDPVTLSGQSYLVVGAPILNSNGQRVGTDVVLFDVFRLREIVDDRTGLGETGTTALGTWRNDRVELFFSQYDEVADLALQTAIEQAVADGESGTQIVPGDTPQVVAFAPVEASTWGLAIAIRRQELYEPIYRDLTALSWTIVGVTVVGTGATVLLLRPFAQRSIQQARKLEQQIEETNALLALKNRALQEKQRQQELVRDALQQIEGLQLSSDRVSQQARAARQCMQQSLELVRTGASSVERALDGTQQVRVQVREIVDRMGQLSESIDRVSTIVELVGDFAAQTNMLALNAAVEAVRAGDSGKGFGVVAGEIRQLADRSQQSSDRIRTLITEIQNEIRRTANATEDSNETADSGVQMARNSSEIFDDIQSAIDEMAATTQQIDRANREHVLAIEALVATVRSIA